MLVKCCGEMGWKPDEFWNCTPSFFYQCYTGFRDAEAERANSNWAQARLIAYYAVAPHAKPHFRITDIFMLPHERAEQEAFFAQKPDPVTLARFNEEADIELARLLKEIQ